MNNCAKYIAEGKRVLGDRKMSDRALGEHLGGIPQQTIADAKAGRMSPRVAHRLGVLLQSHDVVQHAGEVMLVAHAEGKTGAVRATLMDYAKNVLASASMNAAKALAGLAVALGVSLSAHDAQASVGGAGGSRRRC